MLEEVADFLKDWLVQLWLLMGLSIFVPPLIKDKNLARKVLIGVRWCLCVWFVRGLLDYLTGISFAGRTLDFICEYILPVVIVVGYRAVGRFNILQARWLRYGVRFVYTFWLLMPVIYTILAFSPLALVGHKGFPEEHYNGRYFRIESSGQTLSMSDNFHGTDIRMFRKYLLFERRIKEFGFYGIQQIMPVEETVNHLKYDVLHYSIRDTLHGQLYGW